jgi:uncharacterized SAM-binding protein YcdF (DUF218 family)
LESVVGAKLVCYHYGFAERITVFVEPKTKPGSSQDGLVSDLARHTLHRSIFGHPDVLVVRFRRILPFADRAAEVLVVEGWIGREGMRAAGVEFAQRGYQYIVAAGGQNSDRPKEDPSSYAEMAASELIRSGIPKEKIIVAPARDVKSQRTYESAVGVWRALRAKGIQPKSLNVFTYGPHARRSRLVFSKVYGPETEVGVISWVPSDSEALPWWRSSERAREMITETAGYLFEALLNSGRRSNSP